MLRALPHVAAETCFALKGGTAINLFVRNMPRLSVDIDLTYLPVDEPRDTALKKTSDALARIAAAIKKAIAGTRVQESRGQSRERVTKLIVSAGPIRIKIEPNEVIRGCVLSNGRARTYAARRGTVRASGHCADSLSGGPLWRKTLRCSGPSASSGSLRCETPPG